MSGTGESFPTWADKTDAIRDAIAWAAGGINGEWMFRKEASGLPEENEAWFDLRMRRISEVGIDETCNVDNVDPVTGLPDAVNPRLAVQVGLRELVIEARFYNKDQEQDVVAWLKADRARARLRMNYPRDKWIKPHALALVELREVVAMPDPAKAVQMRWQSEAVLQMTFSTVISESDAAAVGTWIEHVEITSKLRNPGGELLDVAIQLNEEVMP